MNGFDMSRENRLDLSCRPVSREERKAARVADLRECTPERRAEIRAGALRRMAHYRESHAKQLANGMPVTQAMLDKNLNRERFMIECLDECEVPS